MDENELDPGARRFSGEELGKRQELVLVYEVAILVGVEELQHRVGDGYRQTR